MLIQLNFLSRWLSYYYYYVFESLEISLTRSLIYAFVESIINRVIIEQSMMCFTIFVHAFFFYENCKKFSGKFCLYIYIYIRIFFIISWWIIDSRRISRKSSSKCANFQFLFRNDTFDVRFPRQNKKKKNWKFFSCWWAADSQQRRRRRRCRRGAPWVLAPSHRRRRRRRPAPRRQPPPVGRAPPWRVPRDPVAARTAGPWWPIQSPANLCAVVSTTARRG